MIPRHIRLLLIPAFVLTLLPTLLAILGADFSFPAEPANLSLPAAVTAENELGDLFATSRGAMAHLMLEWSAFALASLTALLSIVHYRLTRDVTTLTIGVALLLSGSLDAFSAIAESHLVFEVQDPERFYPMCWTMGRTFNVLALISGTLPFLWRRPPSGEREPTLTLVYPFILAAFLVVLAVVTATMLASQALPRSLFPGNIFPRPWDAIPLMLMTAAGGIVLPRFYYLQPGLFSISLLVSMIPSVVAQMHVAFGSSALYDHHFVVSLLLKQVAYCVPLAGLLLDYGAAHNSQLALHATETELSTARSLQQSLLPTKAPGIPGFDLAGFSDAAVAVGGDYFDYIQMADGSFGIVVGDVSGHDIGASIHMSQTRAYLRAAAQTGGTPGELLTRLNRFLLEDQDTLRFVTLVMIRLVGNESEFSYAAAGHNGFWVPVNGTPRELEQTGLPLGFDNQAVRDSRVGPMGTGDVILLMTDGAAEAISPTHEQFGMDRAFQVVSQHRHKPSALILVELKAALMQHCGGVLPMDDVTIVVIKRLANGTVIDDSKSRAEPTAQRKIDIASALSSKSSLSLSSKKKPPKNR